MTATELQQIEQRIAEGYYEADADALRVMRGLVDEIRRFREEVSGAPRDVQNWDGEPTHELQ